MTSNKIVAVHGSYFADNYGDTLLVRILCDKVAALVGKENTYIAVEGIEREMTDIGYPVVPPSQRSHVTHLIFGGGGYFGERSNTFLDTLKWSIRNYKRHLSWVGSFNKARRAVVGVGFGPISNRLFRFRVGAFLKSAELVLVRDAESAKFMHDYGINPRQTGICVDLALSLPLVDSEKSGVALHVDNLSQDEIDSIFRAISSCSPTTSQVDIIFDNKPSDTPAKREKYHRAAAANGITKCNFIPYASVDDLLKRLTTYSFVITSKLHVGITTIAQGGRAIAIPGHQKTIRLYKQLGLESFCISRAVMNTEILKETIAHLEDYAPDRKVIEDGLARVDAALAAFLSQ